MADASPTAGPMRRFGHCSSRRSRGTAQAFEELVSKPSFGVLLARSAENVAALTRIGSDFGDLVLRNLRLAGRADVTRLSRQLHRTEDKLERLLQEVEELRDEFARGPSRERVSRRRELGAGPSRGRGRRRERDRDAGSRPARRIRVRERDPDDPATRVIGQTPREVVWTHRGTTLYRYRSSRREHAIPVLLVFALINRPEIFDLRRGNSFVEFMLAEGFDVFLVDWGVPDEEDAEMGLAEFVCDELHWAVRETLRACRRGGADTAGLVHRGNAVRHVLRASPGGAVRNAVLLTTPIDPSRVAVRALGGPRRVRRRSGRRALSGRPGIGDRLREQVDEAGHELRDHLPPAVSEHPRRQATRARATRRCPSGSPTTRRFPGRAYREWITWMYKENRLVAGRLRLRGERVDLTRIEQNLLVVTADADHIAPPDGTVPLLDLVSSEDVTHLDRPGGHIGLMAGSKAKHEIWPEIADWLRERSSH